MRLNETDGSDMFFPINGRCGTGAEDGQVFYGFRMLASGIQGIQRFTFVR